MLKGWRKEETQIFFLIEKICHSALTKRTLRVSLPSSGEFKLLQLQ